MDIPSFEAALTRDGYRDVRRRSIDRGVNTSPHRHPFDTRLLVLEGELTVICDGRETTCRAGDTVEIERGVEHSERYGPGRVALIAGLKHPAGPDAAA